MVQALSSDLTGAAMFLDKRNLHYNIEKLRYVVRFENKYYVLRLGEQNGGACTLIAKRPKLFNEVIMY